MRIVYLCLQIIRESVSVTVRSGFLVVMGETEDSIGYKVMSK